MGLSALSPAFPEQTAAYLRLADKYGLHITGAAISTGRPSDLIPSLPLLPGLGWVLQNAQLVPVDGLGG